MKKIHDTIYEGWLEINHTLLNVAVLNDTSYSSVVSLADTYSFFDKFERNKKIEQFNVPSWLAEGILAKNLSGNLIKALVLPLSFKTKDGVIVSGINSHDFYELCSSLYKGKLRDDFNESQKVILKDLKSVIVAMREIPIYYRIDRATDFLLPRQKSILNRLLQTCLYNTMLKWATRLPVEFYRELHRLIGLEYKLYTSNLSTRISNWTEKIIKAKFPDYILEGLHDANPDYNKNFIYYAQDEYINNIGNKELSEYISNVLFLMHSCNDGDIKSFWRALARITGQSPDYDELQELKKEFKIIGVDKEL